MKTVLAVLILTIGWSHLVPADEFTVLRPIIVRIQQREPLTVGSADRRQAIAELEQDADRLTAVLNDWHLQARGTAAVYFYRADARFRIAEIRRQAGEAYEPHLARQIVADLDKLIADGVEAPDWSVTIRQAQYEAAEVIAEQLDDMARAFPYYEKCAARDHPGCLNVMANIRLTGGYGQKADIRESLQYHRRVAETGIRNHCAGAFSAVSIAKIVYFTGIRQTGDDELAWMMKAHGFVEQLQAEDSADRNVCNRSYMEMDEFLLRLARGERKDAILQEASGRMAPNSLPNKVLIPYFSGTMNDVAFHAAAAAGKTPYARCYSYFYGMWYAELTGKHAVAQNYYQSLAAEGQQECKKELIYAKKFKF